MKISDLKCGGTDTCVSPIVIACSCGLPVVYLCQSCISNHVLGPGNHLLVNLDQAQQLLTNQRISDNYQEAHLNQLKIKSNILTYIQSLKEFKAHILSCKLEVVEHIEKTIDSNVARLDVMLENTYNQLNNLRESHLSNSLSEYEGTWLEGLLGDYIYNMILNVNEVRSAIENMIIIETRDSPKKHISTKQDLSIDLQDMKELLQAHTQQLQLSREQYDSLEEKLFHLQERTIKPLLDKYNFQDELLAELQENFQLQEDSIQELQERLQLQEEASEQIHFKLVFKEGLIKQLQDKSQLHEASIRKLQEESYQQDNLARQFRKEAKASKDTLHHIHEEINQNIQKSQKEFSIRFAHLKAEINKLKKFTNQIQQFQDDYKYSLSTQYSNAEEEEKDLVLTPRYEEPKPSIERKPNTTIFSLLRGTNKLVRYNCENNTSEIFILDYLPQDLEFPALCMLPNGNVIIAGGCSSDTAMKGNK
jgi:hypothetical protein